MEGIVIKGVNKRIIEIQNIDDGYFERAILIVSEEFTKLPQRELCKKGKEYVDNIMCYGIKKSNKQKNKRILFFKVIAGLIATAGLCVLTVLII